MSEETILTIVSTFAGIVVGFALSQGSELWKGKRRKKDLKKALLTELEIIRQNLLDAQKNGDHVPSTRFPFITETFDSLRIDLASTLEPDQLADAQRTYVEIKKLNNGIEQSDRGYFRTFRSADYNYMKVNLKEVCELVEQTIEKLNG